MVVVREQGEGDRRVVSGRTWTSGGRERNVAGGREGEDGRDK